jgi:hypothetical protein
MSTPESLGNRILKANYWMVALPKNYIQKLGLVRQHRGSSRVVFYPRSFDIAQAHLRWNWLSE